MGRVNMSEHPVSLARALMAELAQAKEATRQARSMPGATASSLARAKQAEALVLARMKAHGRKLETERAEREVAKPRPKRKGKTPKSAPSATVACPTCGMNVQPTKHGALPAHRKGRSDSWCRGGSARKVSRGLGSYSSSANVSVRTVSGGAPGLGKRS